MKVHSLFFLIMLLCSYHTKAQNKELNVYLANGDSIYYCEDSAFNIENLHRSKRSDTSFLKTIISIAKEKNYTVFLKPMTSFSNDAVAENIQNVCIFFRNNNVTYRMLETGSAENKFFGGISMLESIKNSRLKEKEKETSNFGLPPKPPPPPPPPLNELNASALITFILTDDDSIYYYEGRFNKKYLITNFNNIDKVIINFKNTKKKADQFIAIKMSKNALQNNMLDLIVKLKNNGIMRWLYGEYKISSSEQKYLDLIKK